MSKIVRSLSFTRRKKVQQMRSAHLEDDDDNDPPSGRHSNSYLGSSGVRSISHQEPGSQGVTRRMTDAASGAASSAGSVVRSLSFTRRKKKTSGSGLGVPGQPYAAAAGHSGNGNGNGGFPPRFSNDTTHNDFRGAAGEAEAGAQAAEVQRQEQEDYDLAMAMSMSMASLDEQQQGGDDGDGGGGGGGGAGSPQLLPDSSADDQVPRDPATRAHHRPCPGPAVLARGC